jgi:hypothetical protein
MGPAKYPSKKVTFEDTFFRFVHKLSLNFPSKKDYAMVKTPLGKKERRRFFIIFLVFSIIFSIKEVTCRRKCFIFKNK